jgi:hypothetical protein
MRVPVNTQLSVTFTGMVMTLKSTVGSDSASEEFIACLQGGTDISELHVSEPRNLNM